MYSDGGGYVGKKGIQNGGPHVQFGSNRERGFQAGSGNWSNYPYNNGFREEAVPQRGMRPGAGRYPSPHYHDQSHTPRDSPPHYSATPPTHTHHLEGSHSYEYETGEYQKRGEFYGSSSYDYEENRSQVRYSGVHATHGRQFDSSYPSPTMSSSSWSPSHDSPDSPIATPPLPPMRGRGGGSGGGRGGLLPRHPSYEDQGGSGGHYPPPLPSGPGQRRTLLPTQKLTFHHTRPHDMASRTTNGRGIGRPLIPPKRGGYLPSGLTTWDEKQRVDLAEPEGSSLSDQANRDPRLQRKVTQASAPAPAQAPAVKRKPDVHLMVHQILSEHSYCRGRSEGDPDMREEEEEGSREAKTMPSEDLPGKDIILPSSFLSYVDHKVPVPTSALKSSKTRSGKKKGAGLVKTDSQQEEVNAKEEDESKSEETSVKAKGEKVEESGLSTPLNFIGSCSKHQQQLSMFCKTNGELICGQCAAGDGHLNHEHYVLSEVTDLKKAINSLVANVALSFTENKSDMAKVEASVESPSQRTEFLPERTELTQKKTRQEKEEEVEGMDYSISLKGFELDLDTEPSSSEDEEMEAQEMAAPSKEDSSYIISYPSKLSHGESKSCLSGKRSRGKAAATNQPSPDATPVTEATPLTEAVPSATQLPQWSITNFNIRKNLMKFSKVDLRRGSGPFQGIMNGQGIPKKLALFASNSSPSGSNKSDSSEPSPPKRRWGSTESTPVDSDREGELDSRSPSVEQEQLSLAAPAEEDGEGEGRGKFCLRKRRKRWEHMAGRKRRTRKSDLLVVRGDAAKEINTAEQHDTLEHSNTAEHSDATDLGSTLHLPSPPVAIPSPVAMEDPTTTSNSSQGRVGRQRRSTRFRKKAPFKEFKPEILTARSRGETATMKRRREMEKEIERNERERLMTARPEDLVEYLPSPVTLELNLQDDSLSSEAMSSHSLTSSSLMSRDIDDMSVRSVTSSLLEEFSPDVISRCKKITTARNSGDTPLHKVCRTGKYEMARYLIQVDRVPVNAQDNAGWTPLHEACCSHHNRVAELLLKSGADVNISATDGTRPIHDAIESGNLDMVNLLLSYGADPTAEIGEKTPLEFALSNKQFEIHAFLESVIKERKQQRVQKQKPPSSTTPSPTVHKKPTRASKKDELFKEASSSHVAIPVVGYGPDGPDCGEELSYPLFYVTPIIELSDTPFLPAYNFQLVSGHNPRSHNFHLISDILDTLDITESQLLEYCDSVRPLELSVAQVLQQLESSNQAFHRLPDSIMSMPHTRKLKFLPLCNQLRQLLDIEVENLDD